MIPGTAGVGHALIFEWEDTALLVNGSAILLYINLQQITDGLYLILSGNSSIFVMHDKIDT